MIRRIAGAPHQNNNNARQNICACQGFSMLNSMTGFAREVVDTPDGVLTCELRAVNHRYLDVHFRLPDSLRPKEIELKSNLAAVLKRGKVECSLFLKRANGQSGSVTIDEELIAELAARIAKVSEHLTDARSPDPIDILRWPGVVTDSEVDAEPLYAEAQALLENTLQAMVSMRRSEGERIAVMLEERLESILSLAATVRARMPDVLLAIRQKQKDRIDKLDITADPERLETELALMSQKLDVDEELDRLQSHVSEVRAAIAEDEPVGRRLDFLMQELNREANTLGSKSADAETTKAAVELKVLIEQMREQIQNVE